MFICLAVVVFLFQKYSKGILNISPVRTKFFINYLCNGINNEYNFVLILWFIEKLEQKLFVEAFFVDKGLRHKGVRDKSFIGQYKYTMALTLTCSNALYNKNILTTLVWKSFESVWIFDYYGYVDSLFSVKFCDICFIFSEI